MTGRLPYHAIERSDQRVHSLAVVATAPPAIEEAVPPAAGAAASLVRFARLLCSTEGAMLFGLAAALYIYR